jgi:hypothetical protein
MNRANRVVPKSKGARSKIARDRNVSANSASVKNKGVAADRAAVAAKRVAASKADDKKVLSDQAAAGGNSRRFFFVYRLSASDVEQDQIVIFLRYRVQPFSDAVPPACPRA